MREMRMGLCCLLVAGCTKSAHVDENERQIVPPPTVAFDPTRGIIPFPNNLLINPETGRVALPQQCGETAAAQELREDVLNELDGFGTFESAITVPLTAPVDPASLAGRVWLFPLQIRGVPVDPTSAEPVPLQITEGEQVQFAPDCSSSQVIPTLILVPTVPLADASTYGVAVLAGLRTPQGQEFSPSATWFLVRQSEPPVVITAVAPDRSAVAVSRNQTPFIPNTPEGAAAILGLAALWQATQPLLQFLTVATSRELGRPVSRDEFLLAWAFNTQTIQAPLDPRAPGSIAAQSAAATTNFTSPADLQGDAPLQPFLEGWLCALQEEEAGCGACERVPCAAVGAILAGTFLDSDYQTERSNTEPGPFSDPYHPAVQDEVRVPYLAFVPAGAAPAEGWPTVIFGHALTSSKEGLFAIGPQLAAAGLASVAIDWPEHGARAVRTSSTGDCEGAPSPSDEPECFAPFLSTDLATTRDNVRQAVLDELKLVEVLKWCGSDGCGALAVDMFRLGYLGQQLGGIIGILVVAESPEIRVGVLNAAGVGLVDILTDTASRPLRCAFVNGLIAAGVLQGEPSGSPNALCLGEEWKEESAFLRFANTARWVLDPAEGGNFTDRLRDQQVLLQEIKWDAVIPNSATARLGSLLDLEREPANINTGVAVPTPAAAAVGSAWIVYDSSAAGGANSYRDPSLLVPADPTEGVLGTAQMQTDAITFLVVNLSAD